MHYQDLMSRPVRILALVALTWVGLPARPLAALVTVTTPGSLCCLVTTDYPHASTTGVPAGSTLVPVTGNVTLNTPGQIYELREVTGCINVTAANVTIRKVKVGGAACISYIFNSSTNLLVEDTEIDCGNAVGRTALTPQNYTARRVNAYGCENVMWADANVLIEDSYLHDPVPYDEVLDPHTDTVQLSSGASNVTVRNNRIYGGYLSQANFGNAALAAGHTLTNVLFENNLLAGGGYVLRVDDTDQGGNSNLHVKNNRFTKVYVPTYGGFGPIFVGTDLDSHCGSVDHETGAALGGTPACP